MNDVMHAAYSAYLRQVADILALKDWDVLLMRDRASRETRAQVHISPQKDEAAVYLGEDWASFSPEQQRQSLTHELLHAHTARLCRVVSRIEHDEATEVLRYIKSAHDEEEEIVVERLARVIAPFLPLPPEVAP